jgi:hypothetical protein
MIVMKILFLLIALSWSLALVTPSAAQQPRTSGREPQPPSKAESKIKKSTEAEVPGLQQRDLSPIRQAAEIFLRQAAEDAASLDDRRSAVRTQGTAADALWNRDREYARRLFQRAFDAAITYYREGKGTHREQVTRGLSISRPDIRLEIIALVNRRDAALGRQFMEKYVEEKQHELEEPRGEATGPFDSAFGKVEVAAGDFLKIAESLLEVDERMAFGIGQRAFSSGIPQAAGYFFTLLAARNRPAADQMYRMALERLSRDNAPVPGQLLLLSGYPFGDSQVWIAGGDGVNSYRIEVPKDFTVDRQLIQQFISVALTVLNRTAGSDLSQFPDASARLGSALFAARFLEPKVGQFQPALLPEWRAATVRLLARAGDKLREVDQALDQVAGAKETVSSADARERIRQLLDRAQRASSSALRDDLYREAAFEAGKLGENAWALSIADEIEDRDYRQAVRSALNFDAAIRALKEKRFDEAHRLALAVDAIDQQTYLFLEIARAVVKEKDRVLALLDEAARRVAAAPVTPERLRALLGVAHLYASFDLQRSFELATEAVRTANKLPKYDSDQARLVRPMESRSGQGSSVEVKKVEGFDLGKTLAILAGIDFHQALGLAQSLESKPLRLATIVTVGASLMEKKETAKAQ